MKQMNFNVLSITILLVLPVSGAMVRGTITDSAIGLPISNVVVILSQLQGERSVVVDTFVTETNGSYSFVFSEPLGSGFSIRTIEGQHFFQSTHIRQIGIDDTITQDIKLRGIPTKVPETNLYKASQKITIRTGNSRLYLSGITTGAIIEIYNLNGHLLFRAALTAGVTEMSIPGGIAVAGYYQVITKANGRLVSGISFISCIH